MKFVTQFEPQKWYYVEITKTREIPGYVFIIDDQSYIEQDVGENPRVFDAEDGIGYFDGDWTLREASPLEVLIFNLHVPEYK
jgi:hypothetical protein